MATQTSAVRRTVHLRQRGGGAADRGYTGTIPEPSLSGLQSMIANGDFHIVIQAPTVNDARLRMVRELRLTLNSGTGRSTAAGGLRFAGSTTAGGPPGL